MLYDPKVRACCALAMLGLLLPAAGCDDEESGLVCGEGTVAMDGACVAEDDMSSGPATDEDEDEDEATTGSATTSDPDPDPTEGETTGSEPDPSTTTSTGGDTNDDPPASCDDGIQNQGEQAVDCGGPCPACACSPIDGAKRLFLTSQTYEGDLTSPTSAATGLAGGDAVCQLHADQAGLNGSWVAWLSDSNDDAIDRIADVGPWYLPDQCTQIFESKTSITFSGPQGPFNADETGAAVHPAESRFWSSTDRFGQFIGGLSCSGWTDGSIVGTGTVGSSYFDWDHDEYWTQFVTLDCSMRSRILCLEQ